MKPKPLTSEQSLTLEVKTLKEHIRILSDWIAQEGVTHRTCTYYVLGKVCEGCECERNGRKP